VSSQQVALPNLESSSLFLPFSMATWLSSCALSLLLLQLSLQPRPLHATDSLTANQQLSGDQKLISQNGNFALGFFQPAGEYYFLKEKNSCFCDIKMNRM
jgi:hypothetical protein